ncbi:hypothetical protein JKF63_05756 [Porcisia hertigi]|uniref:Protein kinase domain-containing protein n=1 Tax=Porcisia hertigi TaxID=2761500 RepID=A0A836IX44_9TRYP|nr:hypothetical protein JKF63_05756 [Porcisia hertigi]
MSSSDQLTNAYHSSESSTSALSSTLTDGPHTKGKKASNTLVAAVAASPCPATAAAMVDTSRVPGATVIDATLDFTASNLTFVEREQFEIPIAINGGDDSSSGSVVNRRDMSFADISRMRLEGCRARHTSLAGVASLRGSIASPPRSISASPIILTGRLRDQAGISSETATSAAPVSLAAPVRSSLIGVGRSIHGCTSMSSVPTNALGTSVAILQHMAHDTAARVEAIYHSQPLLDTGSVTTPVSRLVVPPSFQAIRHDSVHAHASGRSHERRGCASPNSLRGDSCSDSDRPTSTLRTSHSRPCTRTSISSSPLTSFSESELFGGQLRAGAISHFLSQASVTHPASPGVVAQAPWDSRRSSSAPNLDGPVRAAHRQASVSTDLCGPYQPPAAAATEAEPPYSPHLTRDMSVYNHDFQHVVPLELKEALQRNMCPVCEDDDEEDALLNNGLSVKGSLPLTLFAKVTRAVSEEPSKSGAPGNGAHTRGITDSDVGTGATSGGALLTFSPVSPGTPSALFPSSSAVLPVTTACSMNTWYAGGIENGRSIHRVSSGAADARATGLSISGTGVPFQTWRFPSLGRSSSTFSPRKFSLSEDGKEKRTAAGSTVGCVGAGRQSPVPLSGRGSRHPVRATLAPASRPQQNTEPPLFTRNGFEATGRRGTPNEAAAPPPSQVAVTAPSNSGNVCVCGPAEMSRITPPHQASSDAHGSLCQPTGGAGHHLTQPAVPADVLPSSARGLTFPADSGNTRKLEMVYAVYERLLRARPSTKSLASAFPKGLQALGPQRFKRPLTPPAPLSTFVPPHAAQVGATASVTAGVVFEATRPGGSLEWMSSSSAMGRSAGYYSFGKRISLSHPNRQTLPHQFLGSASGVRAPSFSPVIAPHDGSTIPGLAATPIHNGSDSPTALSSAASTRPCGWDSSLLRRVECRPLLQLTLFLQSNLCSIREAEARRVRGEGVEDTGRHGQRASISRSASSTAVSVTGDPTRQSRFFTEVQSTSVAPSLANVVGVEKRVGLTGANTAEVQGSMMSLETALSALPATVTTVTAASSAPATNRAGSSSSSGGTHVPLAGCVGSCTSSSISKRCNVSCLSLKCIQEAQEEHPHKQTAPCTDFTADSASDAAGVCPPHESDRGPQHRYYRALTEAERLVHHVHGVDGIEREVDNDSLDLVVYVGMHLMGWLEVVSLLGRGSFGQVFLCKDLRICDNCFVHPSRIEGEDYEYWNCSHAYLPFSSVDAVPTHQPLVAVKVVKSVPLLEQQSVLEAEMLVLIGAQTAPISSNTVERGDAFARTMSASPPPPPPEDLRCAHIAKVLADGICYGHHCIVMERYGANLYEYIASNDHRGLPMHQIRSIGAQLFSALSLVHDECHIIHADVKPENVLFSLDFCSGTLPPPKNEPPPVNSATAAATPVSGATGGDVKANTATLTTKTLHRASTLRVSTGAAHGSLRCLSPNAEPPWHQQRTESPVPAHAASASLAGRSHKSLRVAPGGVAQQRLCQNGRPENSNTLLEVSCPAMALATYRGQSLCDLGRSSTSHATVLEQMDLLTPHPRPLPLLSQSAGVRSSAASGVSLRSLVDGGCSRSDCRMQPPPVPREETPVEPSAPLMPRPHIRLIDFSSSCYDGGPFYQYIQSRYYRAPEVIVGAPYNSGIDVWSAGCVLAELLVGMPLLPGCNDHHQLSLIEEMVGPLPDYLVEKGDNTTLFYTQPEVLPKCRSSASVSRFPFSETPGAILSAAPQQARSFALRTRESYLEMVGGEPLPYRRYFTYETLQDLVRHCPLTLEERRMSHGLQPYVPANEPSTIPPDAKPSPSVRSDMMKQRFLLFDLLRRLLQTDPKLRPTAAQALTHPFFTWSPPYLKAFALE